MIHSTAKGILQHDAMTWEAEKDCLVSSGLDELSKYTKTTLGSWLETMDDETRESFCTTAFSLIESTKSETFIEFSGNLKENMEIIWKEMGKLPEEKKLLIIDEFPYMCHGNDGIFRTDIQSLSNRVFMDTVE